MPVYKKGDVLQFPLKLKVLKIFGYKDSIYYIVEVIQTRIPWKQSTKLYGTLDFNGNPDVPEVVKQKADTIIQKLKRDLE